MFLRANRRTKDGKEHLYWSLVETVRTAAGPRQQTVYYLGELNSTTEARWRRTIQIFNAQGEAQQLALFPAGIAGLSTTDEAVQIRLDRVGWTNPRDCGDVYLGWHLWQRLGLPAFWAQGIDAVPAEVPWSRIAAILAINRVCAPGSELAIEARWYGSSALDDLLGVAAAQVNTDRLCRCLDLLLPHKAALERHLTARYGELFGTQVEVLLYDLTSTYVEGEAAGNPRMQRGHSRDHRPDYTQVVLALVVTPEGFPLAYEVFAGNRTDVTTLDEILEAVEASYGRAQRVWVFDRGLVSERNLATLRQRQAQYLVGTPRSQLRAFEHALLTGPWQQVREAVEVQLLPGADGMETFVLCRSATRRAKEQAMRTRARRQLEADLERPRPAVGPVCPTDRSGGGLPGSEKRTGDPADLASERHPGPGPYPGGLPGLRAVGHVETHAQAVGLAPLPAAGPGLPPGDQEWRHPPGDDRRPDPAPAPDQPAGSPPTTLTRSAPVDSA